MLTSGDGARPGTTTLTYHKFRREYWPHFQQSLSKGLGMFLLSLPFPVLTFKRTINGFLRIYGYVRTFSFISCLDWMSGVIMGSEEALTSKTYYLDRDAYLNLGERRQSTFAGQRERIYDLFEKYLNEKRRQNDTDLADR
jgi:hypothetical protein